MNRVVSEKRKRGGEKEGHSEGGERPHTRKNNIEEKPVQFEQKTAVKKSRRRPTLFIESRKLKSIMKHQKENRLNMRHVMQ